MVQIIITFTSSLPSISSRELEPWDQLPGWPTQGTWALPRSQAQVATALRMQPCPLHFKLLPAMPQGEKSACAAGLSPSTSTTPQPPGPGPTGGHESIRNVVGRIMSPQR